MRISNTSSNLSAVLGVLLGAVMAVTAWGATKTTSTTSVDVNSADVKTLETLPGIGSTLANRIVEGRPYKNLDDLGKVKGLSKSKLDSIQDKITFGSTTAKKSASKKTTASATGSASSPGGTSTGAKKSTTKDQTTTSKSSGGSSSSSSSSSGKLTPGQTVNINTATAEELDALPGIGPTKAQAIIDYRNQNGRFSSIEDIEKVKGIKEGEFGKIKDYIRVR
jgi:competence protein ComEA